MQYFCGFDEYTPEPPFDASLMVHFRKRIPAEMVMEITEKLFTTEALSLMDAPPPETPECDEQGGCDATPGNELHGSDENATSNTDAAREASVRNGTENETPAGQKQANRGTLILDATCCPQDIKYPTDIGLLNHARELCEEIIDRLYSQVMDQYAYKPRTYREVARRDFLGYAKKRKHTSRTIRKQIRKQINYVARDLRIIDDLESKGASIEELPEQLIRKLWTIRKLYLQQKEMYENKTRRCDNRIVSISQPHVRPIVRGKEHVPVEFGAKVAIGLVGGYAFITDISWENTAEGGLLKKAAEDYKTRFGFYPGNIIGDGVYPNRENRRWCKERNIRLSGPALGRKNEEIKREEKRQQYQDACERNSVEGSFGTTKRKLGLDLVMTKLPDTSQTTIAMGFFVANMERKLRLLSSSFIYCYIFYDFDLMRLAISDIESVPA